MTVLQHRFVATLQIQFLPFFQVKQKPEVHQNNSHGNIHFSVIISDPLTTFCKLKFQKHQKMSKPLIYHFAGQ